MPAKEPVFIEIVCDTAEAASGIPGILGTTQNIRTNMRDLDAGDYLIGERAVVERKSAPDFIASILDRRLFAQVEMMAATCDLAVILVEGDIFSTRSCIEPVALEGALSWIAVLTGAQLMHSANARQSAAMIAIMARHCQQGLGYVPSLRANKPTTSASELMTRYVLEGLPGVGATTAIVLARHFKTVQAVANASLDDIKGIKGVGDKTAQKIYLAMRGM
ncbi:ERCC4 domain-containing protein [Thiobacillus denitrificans]|uniref:ERCC4 domain-containing protein n=1 Tax=Thiobacillus denitrificans TaxID=36861 RepID=UPI0003A59915|nr:ERCC4 domain-containing protein [Thiobacillus denitrificans]